MNKKLFIRKTHRWLAVIIGIQLLFWTVSGAYFSLIHITTVRGEDRAVETASAILPKHLETVPPGRIVRTMETPIQRLELRMHSNGAPVYALYSKQTGNNRFPFTLIDAQTGQPLPPLDLEQATQRALADYEGNANIKSARLLTDNPPGEYKGPLPVWQVILDDARATHLYVSPVDGHILARRNTWWRTFDNTPFCALSLRRRCWWCCPVMSCGGFPAGEKSRAKVSPESIFFIDGCQQKISDP